MQIILFLSALFILISIVSANDAFADHIKVTITPAQGSGAPGCQETSSGCFIPKEAIVDVGGKVIFYNTDSAAHTFTSGTSAEGPSGVFDSSLIVAGSSYEWTPLTLGEIPYHCMVHPWMEGVIVIQEPETNQSSIPITISVRADKSKYYDGDTIRVSGYVSEIRSGIPVSLRVIAPSNDIVTVATVNVGQDKKFSAELVAGGALMRSAGTYTIAVLYGTESSTSETTFSFGGSTIVEPSGTKIQVVGTDFMISYTITGGKLVSITPYIQSHSVKIKMTTSMDGSLVITLPKSLIDAKMGDQDDTFFVLVDGEEVDFQETTTSTDRTLTIPFPAGSEQIEIVGTSVNSGSNYYPKPDPYTPPYVSTPVIPSSSNIVIPSGTESPGCEKTNSCYVPNKFTVGKDSTVTWFNSDSAAHTITSGIPSEGPTGEFDSSLILSGSSFSHKFNDDGTYPYYCMVHPWMTGYVIVQRGATVISPPTSPPINAPSPTPNTISVSTDEVQYNPIDLVTVKVHTLKNTNVAISVISPEGDSIVSRSVSTDSGGSGSLQFKLPESSPNGSYRVDSTATISGSKVSDSTIFTVTSSAQVNIISLQPTDQQGNPVSSFTKGKLGFVKVVLSSDSNEHSLVTINLFDSELTSLGIGSFKTTLGLGQSEMTLSFFIPSDAESGNGDIYANVFSDWPSQGGVPLTGESSSQVKIQ